MLILAGVTITMVISEDGVINQVDEAKVATEKASLKEEVELAVLAATASGQGKISYDTLNEELKSIGYTGDDIAQLPANILIDGSKYTIGENGIV